MKITILLAVVLMLTSCGPDPRRAAQADEIRIQAEQAAANAEQQRQFAADQHANKIEKQAYWQSVRESTVETAKQVANVFVKLSGLALVVAVCVVVVSSALTIKGTIQGVGATLVRAAEVRANLIYLDPRTGQYPVYLAYLGHGLFALANANTNTNMILDTRNDGDRQMIANSGAVLVAGMVAREAGKSSDPAGVSIIKGQTIEVTSEMIALAKEMAGRRE